jgi:hypothetical protein
MSYVALRADLSGTGGLRDAINVSIIRTIKICTNDVTLNTTSIARISCIYSSPT